MSSEDQQNQDLVEKLDIATVSPPESGPAEEPVAINNESQLFVDDHLIARRTALHRRVNRPRKQPGPFLVADREWEGQCAIYGSIVEHDGEYRLYYKTRNWAAETYDEFRQAHGYGKYPICLARSEDGVAFTKEPVPGAVHEGTNVVVDDQMDCFGILKDTRDDDPAKRFKLLASRGNWWAGLTPATSPDGIQWTWGEPHAVAFFGDRCSYWYDPVRSKHVAWSRNYQLIGGRVIVHKETEDFENWSDVRASHPKLVMMPDRQDHERTQFYGGYAFWYRSVYIAYLEVYYIHHQRLDTQLACSRDGLKWQRLCDRDVFLPNGEHGELDAYWIVPTFNPPLHRDGELLIHYNGRPDPHSQPGFAHVPPGMGGAFGLATLREDGFVSLDATGAEGIVETRPLKLPGSVAALEVNVCQFNTRPGSDPLQVQVDLLNPACELLAAYAIHPDRSRVWYRLPLDNPLPETVRLRFRMRNARLYSFRFVSDQET